MHDPYWTLDTSLFEGTFRYFGPELVLVRGKAHTEQERYRKSDVNLKPFVLVPDIVLTTGT
jgi:hypothetical protein